MLAVDSSSWHITMLLGKCRPYARHVCGSGGAGPLSINRPKLEVNDQIHVPDSY